MMADTFTNTHVHINACLIACANTYTPRGTFLFHTYRSVSLALNSRTYFTSVGQVFLVEVVMRTVL